MDEGCDLYHDPVPEIVGDAFRCGYTAWIDDCRERERRGEKQRVCPVCSKYLWESSFHHVNEVIVMRVGRRNVATNVRVPFPPVEASPPTPKAGAKKGGKV